MGRVIRDMNFTPPSQGGSNLQYVVKKFEETTPELLQDAINAYLLSLQSPAQPDHYIGEMHFYEYDSGGPPGPPAGKYHVCYIWFTYVGE